MKLGASSSSRQGSLSHRIGIAVCSSANVPDVCVHPSGLKETAQLGQDGIVRAFADVDHEGLVFVVVAVARELPVEDASKERALELGVGLP